MIAHLKYATRDPSYYQMVYAKSVRLTLGLKEMARVVQEISVPKQKLSKVMAHANHAKNIQGLKQKAQLVVPIHVLPNRLF